MTYHPAAIAIAQLLSMCFQRGQAAPAMSMEKLSEIVSDGLESCRETIIHAQGIEELEKMLDVIAIRLADISESDDPNNHVGNAASLVMNARMILVEKIQGEAK